MHLTNQYSKSKSLAKMEPVPRYKIDKDKE
jgi:hypothetical protein